VVDFEFEIIVTVFSFKERMTYVGVERKKIIIDQKYILYAEIENM